jgi:hypothetical protein
MGVAADYALAGDIQVKVDECALNFKTVVR